MGGGADGADHRQPAQYRLCDERREGERDEQVRPRPPPTVGRQAGQTERRRGQCRHREHGREVDVERPPVSADVTRHNHGRVSGPIHLTRSVRGEFFTPALRATGMDSIGFVCDPDHPLFRPVAERLAARGFEVEFHRPSDSVAPADVDGLSALVGGTVHPVALAALRYADANGVQTWNGFGATVALSARLVALSALEAAGCRVPEVRFDDPGEGYEPGRWYAWEGPTTLDAPAPFHVEAVGTEPVEHRYYAVDDGRETHMRAVELRAELVDDESVLRRTDVDVSLAASVRELLEQFDARAVAVDFTRGEGGEFYAVRATPMPTFTGAGMDRRVADSVASLTTIGA